MLLPFLMLGLALTAIMAMAYVIQRATGNAGWVDVIWTFSTGFGGAVMATWPLADMQAAFWRQSLMALLIAIWAARLGGHIAWRVAHSDREDPRYARFRKDWGSDFQTRFFRFVIVQGPIAAILAGCVGLAGQVRDPSFGVADGLGVALFGGGIAIEALADQQMRAFRARNPGGVCNVGLWSLSRHPNYVGQWLIWCGVAVVALGGASADAASWLALSGPALMWLLLRYVSGVPPLEAAMVESRGEIYRAYQASVPPFLPRLRVRQTGDRSAR